MTGLMLRGLVTLLELTWKVWASSLGLSLVMNLLIACTFASYWYRVPLGLALGSDDVTALIVFAVDTWPCKM